MERYWDKFELDVETEKVLKARMTQVSIDTALEHTTYDSDVFFTDGLTLCVEIYENPLKQNGVKTFKNRGKRLMVANYELGVDYDIDFLTPFYDYLKKQFPPDKKVKSSLVSKKESKKTNLERRGRVKFMDFRVIEFDGTKYVIFKSSKTERTVRETEDGTLEPVVKVDCYLLEDVIEQLHNEEVQVGRFIVHEAWYYGVEIINDNPSFVCEK